MRPIPRLALSCAALAMLAAACSGDSSPSPRSSGDSTTAQAAKTPATPAPRPARVPGDATYVDLDRSFGGTVTSAGTQALISSMTCEDGVLRVVMPEVVELYAGLPCDRAASQTVADLFLNRPVTMRVIVAQAEKLRLESPTAGTLEFTVSGVWAKE